MPTVPDGGTVTLPLHKTADVVINAAEGVQGSTLTAADQDVVRVEIVGTDEYALTPLAKGTTTLHGTADGDVGTGTLPLTWTATLAVVETKAQSLQVDLHVEQETPLRLPTIGSEATIPVNLTAQLRIRAFGKTGEEVDLAGIVWESGNPDKYTLVANGTNAQWGDLTPLAQFANVPWSFTAQSESDDPGSDPIEAAGSITISGDASLALVVEVDVL
jgi:hypothetical protein